MERWMTADELTEFERKYKEATRPYTDVEFACYTEWLAIPSPTSTDILAFGGRMRRGRGGRAATPSTVLYRFAKIAHWKAQQGQ